ncbi:DUF1062 domain-containing protein [Amycolatopsis sp. cmx-4-83]|uniref:DUF1062 domain-containing protein n=1 Tax=Amycolatopsis sp. cmx-4-83 TaxID=2790940 RepID=UPI00397C70FE
MGKVRGASTPAERTPDRDVLDVEVRSAASIPVRPARLIADGCGLSRGEASRLVEKVVPLPLSGGLRGVDLRAEAGVRGRYGGRRHRRTDTPYNARPRPVFRPGHVTSVAQPQATPFTVNARGFALLPL